MKEHFIEFIIVGILITGLSYTVTTTYKTSIQVEKISTKLEENKENLKKIKIILATSKLNNNTLNQDDIENLISNTDSMDDFFKMMAKEKNMGSVQK
jgi:hypothetical protein